jgi:hypothetical protein
MRKLIYLEVINKIRAFDIPPLAEGSIVSDPGICYT